ncbi:helix-turn-helix transcriptional regulator [Gordonia araii NBRC 100433]|nr:helix-turn-helix transcriptional regulator [Gordonia araii NBRC 100433]
MDTFTMSAVADRLGVVTGAIYRLFPSRDDLVIACLDTAAATLRVPTPGTGWREVLRLWSDECWRVCEEYPGLSRLVYALPTAFTRIDHIFAAYAEALAGAGRTRGQAMFALDFLGDTIFASYLSIDSMRAIDSDGATGLDRVREALDDDSTMRPQDSWTERGAVDAKVDFIIDGLERNWPEI